MNEKQSKNGLCPIYKKCGGCQLQNLSYEKQLSHKQIKVIKLIGDMCHVDEIIGMDDPFHYRNKVQAGFTKKDGRIVSGVYQSTTGRIVPADSCLIENETADRIIKTFAALAQSFKLRLYDKETGKGFLKHVLVKRGFRSGQTMVVAVTAEGEFPSQRSFLNALISRHPEITTVVRNINDTDVGLMLGERNEIWYGEGYIEEELCGMKFRISPRSFYQVNPVQTEVLYGKAAELAGLTGTETLIDAYCGTGTIGLIMSKSAGKVIGVEVNPDGVEDAKANAKLNNVENISFFCADAGAFMKELAQKGETADIVVTDPPRAGCSIKFLKSLIKLSPEKIVYISCNPETLARDMRFLTKHGGYRAVTARPVDMFPFTSHVECVVLMSKTNQ